MENPGIRYFHSDALSNEAADFQKQLYENRVKGLFVSVMANSVDPTLLKQLAGMDNITTAAPIPQSLSDLCAITTDLAKNRTVWTLTPRNAPSGKVIFYLHGGGYVMNITSRHWVFLEDLCRHTHATIVIPDYPLAPASTWEDVYACVETAYGRLVETIASDQVVVMGDSAGGGLCLGLVQKLRNDGRPLPEQVIVLSPWLDVTVSNPAMDAIDDRDHLLGTRGLVQAGQAYAGTTDLRDFRISPIYGSFSDFPPLSIFQGTHDIFLADSQKLVARLEQENRPINYFEFQAQCHVWAIFPLPEAQVASNLMATLVNGQPIILPDNKG